ncbi:hypothetical protein GCM10009530_56850 [Microbispora corallina]|uniref:Transposase n=1 Tax=Microbispora corallina TaxID=83302 RepID=A0ABQ4G8T8_9ACTN|nr:hypothetical protein Mco01_64930 [Microbispora corallina]
MSLVSVDSTTARAHHDVAGMDLGSDLVAALEKAAEEETARQKGATRKDSRSTSRKRPRSRTTATYRASAWAPAESCPARTLQGRADQQDPPYRRPQVPPAGVRLDRRTGCRQPAVHPRAEESTRPGTRRPSPHPARRGRRRQAYSSCGNRAYLRRRRIKVVIPEKRDQAANRKKKGTKGGRPVSHDAGLYKERNTVERLINKRKAWLGITTRSDKAPASYLAGLHLRAAMIWIKELPPAGDDKLTNIRIRHYVTASPPILLGARKIEARHSCAFPQLALLRR